MKDRAKPPLPVGVTADGMLGLDVDAVPTRRQLVLLVAVDPTRYRRSISEIRRLGCDLSLVMRYQEAASRAILLAPSLIVIAADDDFIGAAHLCASMLSEEKLGSTPVVVVIPEQFKEQRRKFFMLGARDCLACGDDPDEVILRVDACLRERAKSRQEHGATGATSRTSLFVQEVCAFLLDRLGQDICIQRVERHFGTDRRRLNEWFVEELGMTMVSWIRTRRMEHALDLLQSADLEIQEIAQIVGYSSVCNFSTAFRHRFGLSPRQYRASANKELVAQNAGARGLFNGAAVDKNKIT